MNQFFSGSSFGILVLINLGTVLGLSGIDLILPSIPDFTEVFPGSSPAEAQWIIAFYVLGTSIGLLVFSFLADRFDPIHLFSTSLLCFAALSLLCIFSTNIHELIVYRFLQGLSSSGAAVLAPGLIRGLFSSHGAMRAISIMGSVESMVPAFAPLSAVLFLIGAYFRLDDPIYLICYFVPINIGLGLRGGAGFVSALIAAGDNDARGSAFMILAVTILSGGITGILSPFLKWGLSPIAIAMSVLILPSMVLVLMKKET